MKICYVILHYQNLEVTQECVQYIDEIKNKYSKIIIVDNASPNQSGIKLKKFFNDRCDVIIIQNDENLGFAKGNNIGYSFAKEKEMANIIVVMNNDVFIKDKTFENKIIHLTDEKKYDIIAPDIITLDHSHQNPHRTKKLSTYTVLKRVLFYSLLLIIFKANITQKFIIDKINNRANKKNVNQFYEFPIDDIVPHGACVIYTKNYIKNENFAFLPKTFLFSEEDFLYDYSKKKNYIISYQPTIKVNHLEDASINYSQNTDVDKFVFNLKHRRNSLFSLLKNRLFYF